MKIEIGKKYKLEPTYKKSVVDVEHYSGKHGDIDITTVWRWGSWYVTPQSEFEVGLLEKAMQVDIELCISGFEDYEMLETWDGCSCELEYVSGDWTEDQVQLFEEEYYEDSFDTLDKYDFQPVDCETYINSVISLEEV